MKTLIIFLITVAISILPCHAAGKVEANPINVAYTIAEKTDSVRIASTLDYYGYVRHTPQDNYIVFIHPNGSGIRYTFTESGEQLDFPKVQVFSKINEKDKKKILTMLRFKKSNNYYERKNSDFDRYVMQCHKGSKNSLIFYRQKRTKSGL